MPKGKKASDEKFSEKLSGWFASQKISDHKQEIIKFLDDKKNDFRELGDGVISVVFWSARLKYKDILEKALERKEAAGVINVPYRSQTALSMSAYFGYHEITSILLEKNALIKVKIPGTTLVASAYQDLGRGYVRWPTDVKNYKKAFEHLVTKDPDKPKRKFFSDEYNSTKNKGYLVCLRFYDQLYSGMKDKKDNCYKQRDILTVEDAACRRFFRFNKDMRVGGVAKALSTNLFNGQSIPVDGYTARSVIISLVDKMRTTDAKMVQKTVDNKGNVYTDPNKRIFSVTLTLGTTKLSCDWRPQPWQRGNCVLKVNDQNPQPFGSTIAIDLERLTDTDNDKDKKCNSRTKRLGELFLEKTKQLQPFRHFEFSYRKSDSNKLVIRVDTDNEQKIEVASMQQAQDVIHKLNGLLILWSVVEPVRRLSGHQSQYAEAQKPDAIAIDHIPVATMQIRALQLLANGTISIMDIFGKSKKYAEEPYEDPNHNAEYGVSTGKDLVANFSIVKEKAKQLADLSLSHVALASKLSWFSRNYVKQVLRSGYGSANESDSEDYSDDELPEVFTP